MDLKGWAAAVAQRSSQLAREGIHYVEKKIEQQQQHLQQQTSWGGNLFRRGSSHARSSESDPVSIPSVAIYYIQASDCRGFPPIDAAENMQQQKQRELIENQVRHRNLSADCGPNCSLLPPGIAPEEITVGLFKTLFSPPGGAQGAPYHLRFRAPCPGTPSGFVWVDAPPEDQPVPTCSSSSSGSCIVCKALLLPPSVQPRAAAATQAAAAATAAAAKPYAQKGAHEGPYFLPQKQQSKQQRSKHRQQQHQQQQHALARDSNLSSSSDGPSDAWAVSAYKSHTGSCGKQPNGLVEVDILGETEMGASQGSPQETLHFSRAHSVPTPQPHVQELLRFQTVQNSVASVEVVPPRAELAANREAKKQQRMMEKLQEVERRRAQEAKQQQDKLALPEELKLELDRWAKTADGSFKDVRTLLSTLHEVLWPDAAWEPVSLSSLMMPATLKKQFRRALLLAHPDKHQNADPARQYRAERVFQALNESFKTVST